MKKLLSIAALSLMFGSSAFAMPAHSGMKAVLYGGGVSYSNSSSMNYKYITGVTLNKKVGANNFMGDLKYIYFNSDIVKPHKWDLSMEYTINNLSPRCQFQVGGKLVDTYKNGNNMLYTGWIGVNEKRSNLLQGVKTGMKVYYSDLSNLLDNKILQVDASLKTKRKHVAKGVLLLNNTLTYQKFDKNDFDGNSVYISDTLAAKLVKGKHIFMGHVSLGHSALKIVEASKYGMDTTGNIHKWGVGVGAGYRLHKNDMIVAKVSYDKLKTSFGDDNAAQTKYIVAYLDKF